MSLQWTLVAAFLYAEIAVVIVLMLPFVSATVWQKFFKSRFLKSLAVYSNFYFSAFFVILLLLFLDSLRQMHKYSSNRDQEVRHGHLDAEVQQSMKMFLAQRNCYISGFALFLAPVIRRIGTLLSSQATLIASHQASLRQAKSATETAEKLLKEKEKSNRDSEECEDNEGNLKREEYEKKIQCIKDQLKQTEEELVAAKRDLVAVKEQAEGTSREYDRLLNEHEKLQQELEVATGETKNKKEE